MVEVDFVAEDIAGGVLPIEVKFRRQIDLADTHGLRHFIQLYKAPYGIMVTRDTCRWDPSGPILMVPLMDFLARLR